MRRKSEAPRGVLGDAAEVDAIRNDLEELARNLWWSWDPEALSLWQRVALEAPETSEADRLRNPLRLVQALHAEDLLFLAGDPTYRKMHRSVLGRMRAELRASRCLEGFSARSPVAYFSMEFGIHESLPVYAGGLGILAGDHLKSSSDEHLPLVGVGLFYHDGYFRQELDSKGRQVVVYPKARVSDLPMEAVCSANGRELRIRVNLLGNAVALRAWKIRVGRVPLYLLDADLPENRPEYRRLTHRLYGGTREDRIRQEILAGIGGVRLLEALGIRPSLWHLNEGHVAFLTLERLRRLRLDRGISGRAALELIAANTVFTTHTPVPEGNEVFDLALAHRYLEEHALEAGVPLADYLSLGLDHDRSGKPLLSMTVLAIELSRFRNGVSRLHGEVSRGMWRRLWPGFSAEDAPITSVTNGVHTQSWVAPAFDELLRTHVGSDWRKHLDDPPYWKATARIPDEAIWETKQELKRAMVCHLRDREVRRLERLQVPERERQSRVEGLLDPQILTIGFARRFALYKRAALLFRDAERARRLFASRSRPVQIVFAGKPHPEDAEGKALFERIGSIASDKRFRGHVFLFENYDIELCRYLVQGVDVWLNNPRRPLEASGTSGQKVPVNAGLNLSVLDGWWCEGYAPHTGWAFGSTEPFEDPDLQDDLDSDDLLRTLEKEVIPLYYDRDRRGIPVRWIKKAKTSMAALVPRFSTSHMVREYASRLYAPAVEYGKRLSTANGAPARELAEWKERTAMLWPLLHVRSAARKGRDGAALEVFLAGMPPEDLGFRSFDGRDLPSRLEGRPTGGVARFEVRGIRKPAGGGVAFRLFPRHPLFSNPVEFGLALPVVL